MKPSASRAGTRPSRRGWASRPERSLVVNIDPLDQGPDPYASSFTKWRYQIAAISAVDAAGLSNGVFPRFIVATPDPHKLMFSNMLDSTNHGLMTLEVSDDRVGSFAATVKAISTQFGPPDRNSLKLSIDNPSGIAVLPDLSYAFVMDYFLPGFPGPIDGTYALSHWVWGSKVAVIKDPFGAHPTMLGATSPVDLGFGRQLTLSRDGQLLFANYPGANAVVTFDVQQLLAAAATPKSHLESHPLDAVDLNGDGVVDFQVVRPGIVLAGTSVSLASASVPVKIARPQPGHYGDVIGVDLGALLSAPVGARFFASLDSFVGGKVATVTYDRVLGVRIVQDGDTGTAPGGTDFAESGFFYLVPDLDPTAMRNRLAGESLPSRDIVGQVGYIDANGHAVTQWLQVHLIDGYTAINLLDSVGDTGKNRPIDVYRVQQRLRYLGYPGWGGRVESLNPANNSEVWVAHGDPETQGGSQPIGDRRPARTVALDFEVTGKVAADQTNLDAVNYQDPFIEALKLFQASTLGYRGNPYRDTLGDTGGVAATVADGLAAQNGDTIAWLNATNAPMWRHLPLVGDGYAFAGWYAQQSNGRNFWSPLGDDEAYGTSWAIDLITAAVQLSGRDHRVVAISNFYSDGAGTMFHGYHKGGMDFDLMVDGLGSDFTGLSVIQATTANPAALQRLAPLTQSPNAQIRALAATVNGDFEKRLQFYLGWVRPGHVADADVANLNAALAAANIVVRRLTAEETRVARDIVAFQLTAQGGGVSIHQAETSYTAVRDIVNLINNNNNVGFAAAHLNHTHFHLDPPARVALLTSDAPASDAGLGSALDEAALRSLLSQAESLWTSAGLSVGSLQNVSVADLPDSTLALESFENGTLSIGVDRDADGHGWFIDATPLENEEFEFDPSGHEWVALANGAAEGRMDLLTVLSHEIGHLAGLQHADPAAEPGSFMLAMLGPGIRRLPEASALDGAPTDGESVPDALVVAPAPDVSADGVMSNTPLAVDGPPMSSQAVLSTGASAPIVNGSFDVVTPGDPGFGWATRGSPAVQNGRVVLFEDPRLTSDLSQTFVVPAGAVALAFDLVDADFDAPGNGPVDAFEVALLDAGTLAPVSGITGLTRTDALLNIQATGRIYAGAGVSLQGVTGDTLPADVTSPIRVEIDLAGVDPGRVVSLYFDLLGFGDLGSSVIIDNVAFLTREGNTAPGADSDAFTTAEDTPRVLDVLANDSDAENDVLSAVIVTSPEHGTLAANPDGTFTYTPAQDYFGPDAFTYRASDGQLESAVATVALTVTPVNDAPSFAAGPDQLVLEDAGPQSVPGWASAISAGPENESGQGLKFIITGNTNLALFASAPAVGDDGALSFTPAADAFGAAVVTLVLRDGAGTAGGGVDTSAPQSFTITVVAVNDAPVAISDGYEIAEDTTLVVAAPGVLGNDTDVEGDALTAILVAGPAHGALALTAHGSITYTPAKDYFGGDGFTYRANDGALDSALASVTIEITPVNDSPVGVSDAYVVQPGRALTVAAPGVLANDTDVDGDVLHVTGVVAPEHGTLSLEADGSFVYTPAAGFTGDDGFRYTVADGAGGEATADVALDVRTNAPPVASPASSSTPEDTVLMGAVTGTDPDGDLLHFSLAGGPAHGTLVFGEDGGFTYTPTHDFFGADGFSFTVSDGTATSAPASVALAVTPVNDAPEFTTVPITRFILDAPAADLPRDEVFRVAGAAGHTVSVRFDWLLRAASFDNEVGIYRVSDLTGRVGDLAPGDAGYAKAALSAGNATVLFSSGKGAGAAKTVTLRGGELYAYYIVQDGTTKNFLAKNAADSLGHKPLAFFSIAGANPDQYDHLRASFQADGRLKLAWEDGTGGGDQDFDDVVVRGTSFVAPPAPVPPSYVYPAHAEDVEGDPVSYRLEQGPAGARMNAQTGEVVWTPAGPGIYHFVLDALDGHGGVGEQVFDLRVSQAEVREVVEGSTLAFQVAAPELPGSAGDMVFALVDGPEGAELSAGGLFSYTAVEGPASHRVVVEVSAGEEPEVTALEAFDVRVLNAPPEAQLSGPASGVRGQMLAFTGGFTDAGALDTHQVAMDWGDGTSTAFHASTDAGALTPSHVYASAGIFQVTWRVRDDDGGEAVANRTLAIVGESEGAVLQPDPEHPGKTMLVVRGTSKNDEIKFLTDKATGGVKVQLNALTLGPFAVTGRLVAYGLEGDDDIAVESAAITLPVEFYGGRGRTR